MFACTSICFGDPPGKTIILNSDNGGVRVAANSVNPDGTYPFPLDPIGNILIIGEGASVGDAFGAYIDDDSDHADYIFPQIMLDNKIIVRKGSFNGRSIYGAYSLVSRKNKDVDIIGNIARINAGNNILDVFGGYTLRGEVLGNEVFINNGVTIGHSVYGGFVKGNEYG